MDANYIQKIQSWVEYDNKIIKNRKEMEETVEKKKILEDEILHYMEENKYDKFTVNISDGAIKFGKRNVTQPLSMKLLRQALEKYAEEKNDIDVEDILDFVTESQETKTKYIMKREVKE